MSTPYRLWEILQRSYTGPHCEEDEFLPRKFTPKLEEVIKKYEIKYDHENPVPADDDLSDRVWQAGWELFRDVGLYNTDTHRIIQVSEDEIKEALYLTKGEYWVGAGKDAVLWRHRQIEDQGRSSSSRSRRCSRCSA